MAKSSKPMIGAGHPQAWLRAGFKELAQVLPAFPAHSVQPVEEPGLAGNPTAVEVYRGKEPDPTDLASARAREAGRGQDLGQERSF